MSETITAGHVQRKAIVYVRQSTQQQVVHNQESRRLQYRMVDRMVSLGWKKPDVEVIDDDLGVSASGSMERVGFQRMVAEVCLGRVGAVAARELSRFARNSSDWQQLIEMCGFVGALLVDEGTVYDPHRADDRLMLGVKGSMSEYELHLIKERSLKARNAKAARGELVANVPAGYIKTRGQRFEMDPDQRVQESIRMVFSKILELGSARQVSLWLIEEDLQLPAWRHGVLGWETLWKRPTYQQVRKILRNPAYAGAYAFGRTREARMLESDGTVRLSRLRKPREEWSVLIRDHHPGYVSWETYERIQTMLVQNRTGFTRMGAARKGEALLVGLLRCRRCGRNLGVDYTTRSGGHVYRYGCRDIDVGPGEPRCLSLGGPATDRAVSAEVLRVIQPAAVEAALAAASEENADRGKLTQALLLELEAARYEAARAQKQYDLVDPENRLVARSLEDRWNEALALVERLERRVGEARREQSSLPALELSRLMELARDVEAPLSTPAAPRLCPCGQGACGDRRRMQPDPPVQPPRAPLARVGTTQGSPQVPARRHQPYSVPGQGCPGSPAISCPPATSQRTGIEASEFPQIDLSYSTSHPRLYQRRRLIPNSMNEPAAISPHLCEFAPLCRIRAE